MSKVSSGSTDLADVPTEYGTDESPGGWVTQDVTERKEDSIENNLYTVCLMLPIKRKVQKLERKWILNMWLPAKS